MFHSANLNKFRVLLNISHPFSCRKVVFKPADCSDLNQAGRALPLKEQDPWNYCDHVEIRALQTSNTSWFRSVSDSLTRQRTDKISVSLVIACPPFDFLWPWHAAAACVAIPTMDSSRLRIDSAASLCMSSTVQSCGIRDFYLVDLNPDTLFKDVQSAQAGNKLGTAL